MKRIRARGLVLATTLGGVAAGCSELVRPLDSGEAELFEAFSTMPVGYSLTQSTFSGQEGEWTPARPGTVEARRLSTGGPGGDGGGHGGLMGGGLIGPFMGDGLGPHIGTHPFGGSVIFADCPFDMETGRVVCEPILRGGLTVLRSAAFLDLSGQPQRGYVPGTTSSVNARVSVEGTIDHPDRTTSVRHGSDRTVTGFAEGSTRRTVNGNSEGRETTVGTRGDSEYTLVRTVGDTIRGVVIPIPTTRVRPYPVDGTIIRSMRLTLTQDGARVRELYRREEITYDGSDTATLEITVNGNTRVCTLPLPHGRPNCRS